MRYFLLCVLACALFGCGEDNSVAPSGNATIHVRFVATCPGISAFDRSGEGTFTVPRGKVYNDSIFVTPNEPSKWSFKVLYYNSATDHKIYISAPAGDRTISFENNRVSSSGFGGAFGASANVTGFVEE